ncbi:MAG: hypothetical protein Q7S48_00445 [bacterium]|nr:hypothetical protein [bacterium]
MPDNLQAASDVDVEEKNPTILENAVKTDKTSDITEDTVDEPGRTISGSMSSQELTPLEENDIRWRQSETNKNKAKTACWTALKPCIIALSTILSLLLIFLSVFWAYKISSISEPIGGIKNEIGNLNKYNDQEVKPRLKDWDSAYTQLKVKEIITP